MEGLERILVPATFGVHEASPGFGRDVWVNRVPLKTTLAPEARLLKRTLRRDVLSVTGSLNSIDAWFLQRHARERLNRLGHEALTPVRRRENVADINRGSLHASFKHSDGYV